jgi:hypothetical protein
MQPCDACYRQLKSVVSAVAHPDLAETDRQEFGAGSWRWSETVFECGVCGMVVLHTTSKTHRGPTWTRVASPLH